MMVLISCTAVPKGLAPVEGFDIESYLGKWYEIGRLDHTFERNMSNVSATYTVDDSGDIAVVNRGYKADTGEWKSIQGVARPIGNDSTGSLKVSFFGPFYGGYHIIDLDRQNYSYAMVVGPSRSYFWILSRERVMDEELYKELVTKAAAYGIDTKKLIRVEQNLPEG
jgi:apolipoprotein D and lipocalin family protein